MELELEGTHFLFSDLNGERTNSSAGLALKMEEKDRASPSALKAEGGRDLVFRFLLLSVLVGLACWIFPVKNALRPSSQGTVLWGVVRASPEGEPIPGAYVVSEQEVAVTDKNGCFRIRTSLGEKLLVEARGYKPLRWRVDCKKPQVFLLVPAEKQEGP